tara:strand:+ start:167 stop:892 length:726 start_codon:yes stop_codon:yes gene_type:complete
VAGHSKWSNIKHRKGAQDAKKGKIFTKIIKEITVSTRIGGSDIESNSRLRKAIQSAKSNNMPFDNIKRAIKKGSGSLAGVKFEKVIYEGYGPSGVAIMLEVITDNKNRSVAEIRNAFSKFGGKLGENGSVSWLFEKKGIIILKLNNSTEEILYELAIKAGVEDIEKNQEVYIIKLNPKVIYTLKEKFDKNGFSIVSVDIELIPKTYQIIKHHELEKLNMLFEIFENNEDINTFYSNFKIDG